jgi:hypothetical protein
MSSAQNEHVDDAATQSEHDLDSHALGAHVLRLNGTSNPSEQYPEILSAVFSCYIADLALNTFVPRSVSAATTPRAGFFVVALRTRQHWSKMQMSQRATRYTLRKPSQTDVSSADIKLQMLVRLATGTTQCDLSRSACIERTSSHVSPLSLALHAPCTQNEYVVAVKLKTSFVL